VYYTSFPLLFHPLVLRKFGHNMPLGVISDENVGIVFQKSLSEGDLQTFKTYLAMQQMTKEVLKWVTIFPDLSLEQT
jgi:hypothetical protein